MRQLRKGDVVVHETLGRVTVAFDSDGIAVRVRDNDMTDAQSITLPRESVTYLGNPSMTLYVAEMGYSYEGSHTTGVFSTEPLAREWIDSLRGRYSWDWESVTPYKLDEPEWDER